MKKIVTLLGLAGIICLFPECKKSKATPDEPAASTTQIQAKQDTALLYVSLDSKPCDTPQDQYTSATVDIRGIRVNNSVHGWEELTPVPGAWDVVSLQDAPVPVAEITENSPVHTGMITQIALTFGDNNQLVVNDAAAHCYKLSEKEIILNLQAEIKAGMLNQIVVSIDICGNISVNVKYDEEPCYTLHQVMAVQSFTSYPLNQ